MGWYQGLGGRLVATVQPTNLQDQPDPIIHLDTNSADASNWHVSASWAVPTDAVSGVYIGKLVREDGNAGENYIVFVVRDDEGHSDLLFQTSDETWQAYNTWGGSSLYAPNYPNGRAYAVSYSRPFNTLDDTPLNFYFGEEMAMTRFIERNGYDVSYTSGIDVSAASVNRALAAGESAETILEFLGGLSLTGIRSPSRTWSARRPNGSARSASAPPTNRKPRRRPRSAPTTSSSCARSRSTSRSRRSDCANQGRTACSRGSAPMSCSGRSQTRATPSPPKTTTATSYGCAGTGSRQHPWSP